MLIKLRFSVYFILKISVWVLNLGLQAEAILTRTLILMICELFRSFLKQAQNFDLFQSIFIYEIWKNSGLKFLRLS